MPTLNADRLTPTNLIYKLAFSTSRSQPLWEWGCNLKKVLNWLLQPFGLTVVKTRNTATAMLYQHEYVGGYEQYRDVQIFHNKRKLQNIWADDITLTEVLNDLKANGLNTSGICHGARNGFEVEWFRKELGGDVIGTDISDTATQFAHMHVWDFQQENPEWIGKFDFVYTNSLDQAMSPDRALKVWAQQLKPNGRIYIEHTMAHSPEGAGEMDPFGAHPFIMPYLLFLWGRDDYKLVDILEVQAKKNNRLRAWIFVLTPSL